MTHAKRAFIFGAGFSKPAKMPLATELLPLLMEKLDDEDMREWLNGLRDRLDWLSGNDQPTNSFSLNIEEVFHYATFDIEVFRLRQHMCPVGRAYGQTPSNAAESIASWLSDLGDALVDVLFERDEQAELGPITRWARAVNSADTVMTFNYDTLVERALSGIGQSWNHGTGREGDTGIAVCKLHGSIDWVVANRSAPLSSNCDLLFDKPNANGVESNTGHIEEDCQLWRCRTREQLKIWMTGRDLQFGPWKTVGIAGLGSYKQLHVIPGLGPVWARGMRALYEADTAIIVGFSMSDFDKMAQMQFAEIARMRKNDGRPLRVTVIDPSANDEMKQRFNRLFRNVEFVEQPHEDVDWNSF